MKQKKIVSMIGALVLIISAVSLFVGCDTVISEPNKSSSSKSSSSSSTDGNTGGSTGANTGGSTGGGTSIALDGVIAELGKGSDGALGYYYFFGGVVYFVQYYPSGSILKSIAGSYSGNSCTVNTIDLTYVVKPSEVIMIIGESSKALPRMAESDIRYKPIKNASVNN